jgi:RNA polymerase sigma factor (TIGR02999 family)
MIPRMGPVTRLLEAARRGDDTARDRLFAHLYGELDRLAQSHLARNAPMTLIDAPALIREVWLRLHQQETLPGAGRPAFLAYASRAMRSVIVDYLRARGADRRGAGVRPITLSTIVADQALRQPEIESLDDALRSLERIDERAHRVVEMRYFGGMEIEEIAEHLAISPATVKRDWQKARAYLLHVLAPADAAT